MTHASKPSLFSKFNAISSMDYHILIRYSQVFNATELIS